MKLGSSSFSFRRIFDAKEMDHFSWLDYCARNLQLDGVELLDQHFPNTSPAYLKDVKKYATTLGLTISCASVTNDFSGPSQEAMENLEKVKKWVEIAQLLGAPILRILAGNSQAMKVPEVYQQVVENLQKSVIFAERVGVVLGLENQGGMSSEQVLQLLKDVNSSWLKLTLDTGSFPSATYKSIDACLPQAVIVHANMYKLNRSGEETELNYQSIMKSLKKNKYVGFVSIEFEGEGDEMKFMPKGVKYLRSLIADHQATAKKTSKPKARAKTGKKAKTKPKDSSA